jgi:lantibiotic modifying enzyme
MALALAHRLVDDAFWHERRCSWIAPEAEPADEANSVVARSLRPDLYEGTAGIGLALAEVAAATGDADCRRTALGAIRHALAHATRVDGVRALGLYTGVTGIVLAAVRSGQILGHEELIDGGRRIAAAFRQAPPPSGVDLIAGRAGSIVGLLALDAALGRDDLLDVARRLGDELLERKTLAGRWSWRAEGTQHGLERTGLAHGAAGVGFALRELGGVAGRTDLMEAADRAIEDENVSVDDASGNWREDGRRSEAAPRLVQTTFMSWCHGAPGIGLARHRAWRTTGEPIHRADAARAARMTAAWVRAAIVSGRGQLCLCHGVAGNAEIVGEIADAVDGGSDDLLRLPAEAAEAGIVELRAHGTRWPPGLLPAETPGLMLGLAGAMRFYLRLARPELPSLLLIRPEEWAPRPGGVTPAGAAPASTSATAPD